MTELEQLRAEVERLREQERNAGKLAVAHFERAKDAESRLAAANALLRLVYRCGTRLPRDVIKPIASHLAAQPASAPTRTEAEQRVLDACAAWSLKMTAGRADGSTVTQYGDPMPVVRAELTRRGLK